MLTLFRILLSALVVLIVAEMVYFSHNAGKTETGEVRPVIIKK